MSSQAGLLSILQSCSSENKISTGHLEGDGEGDDENEE